MEVIDPRSFLSSDMFREKEFREAVKRLDWSRYKGKPVLVQGCSSAPIPTWAYLVITAEVAPYAKSVSFGELKNPVPVFGKLGAAAL